jgi:hypothetical protein
VTKKHEPALSSPSVWKPIFIALGVLGVLIVIALGAMYYVAGTPAYSLYKLRAAIREGDFVTFDEHFDTKKVISNAIQREVGGLPAGPRIVSQKAIDMLIPASEKIIKARIQEKLAEKGSPMLGMSYVGATYVNNAAIVTLRDPADGSETKITLERLPNRQWKVVDLDLGKAGVTYSLKEAREMAEELMQPIMPTPVKPGTLLPDGVPPGLVPPVP